MTGIDRIAAERERQIEELGYDADHDAQHTPDDLAFAAACYASPATIYLLKEEADASVDGARKAGWVRWVEPWPGWERDDIRDRSVEGRIRELEKAGALIAAEIDRLLEVAGES